MIWSRPRDRSPVARRCNPNKSTAFPPSIQPVRSTRSSSFVTLYRSSHSSYPDLLMLSKLPLDSGTFNLRDYCQLPHTPPQLSTPQVFHFVRISPAKIHPVSYSPIVSTHIQCFCTEPLQWYKVWEGCTNQHSTMVASKTDRLTDRQPTYVDVIKPVCWSKCFIHK